MPDEPKCPHCLNADRSLIDEVPMPRWTGVTKWACTVCSKTWIVKGETQ